MQDLLPIPSCFYSGQKPTATTVDPNSTKLGQSVVMSAYRTRIDGIDRTVTVTWCKNLLAHGLSVSIEGSDETSNDDNDIDIKANSIATPQHYSCRVEMRPWSFWRRHGSKRFHVEGIKPVDVFWDLRNAKYSDEPEPLSDYYVAVVYEDEVVLLLGNLKNDAFLRTGSRPSIFDPVLVSKKEHVFGKKRFSTRAKFHDKGKFHVIMVECNSSSSGTSGNIMDSDMVIKIDGDVGMRVKHLQWKFRGNESISINKVNVEVYWDVHDWLFSPGMRHALFIFKPIVLPSTLSTSSTSSSSSSVSSWDQGGNNSVSNGGSDFCLFLYAWKLE